MFQTRSGPRSRDSSIHRFSSSWTLGVRPKDMTKYYIGSISIFRFVSGILILTVSSRCCFYSFLFREPSSRSLSRSQEGRRGYFPKCGNLRIEPRLSVPYIYNKYVRHGAHLYKDWDILEASTARSSDWILPLVWCKRRNDR